MNHEPDAPMPDELEKDDTGKTFVAFGTPSEGPLPQVAYSQHETPDTIRRAPAHDGSSTQFPSNESSFESQVDARRELTVDEDKYKVIQKLGDGGMGAVWLVEHRQLKQKRAIKVIRADSASEPVHRARFEREAQVLAKLDHPNAVRIHDFVIYRDGAYIDMEFLEGITLRQWITPGAPKSLKQVDWLLKEICAVMEAAHELGIVHRDLKPENIMILKDPKTGNERVKVLDFGIAKIVKDVGDSTQVSLHTEGPVGTFHYASPEQLGFPVAPELNGEIDHRSDLYSIGVLLYELLAGARPFTGVLTKLLYDHGNTPPPSFAEKSPGVHVDPAVEKVVLKCLEKRPAKRPQSAKSLYDQFHDAAGIAALEPGDWLPDTELASNQHVPGADKGVRKRKEPTRSPFAWTHRSKMIAAGIAGSCALLAILAVIIKPPGPKTFNPPPPPPSPISAAAAVWLGSHGYKEAKGSTDVVDGWPKKITPDSGRERIFVRLGTAYFPQQYSTGDDNPDKKSATGLPASVVDQNGTRFILIEGGTFPMGAWQSGAPFRDEERPGHPFTLSSYYIQQTEVTYGEFSRFLQDSSITKTDARLQYYFQVLKELDETLNDKAVRDKRPAVCVSWELAKLYATYAGGDLPSEAQWEFAARSRGKKQYYVWGDDPKGLEKRSNWAWVNRTNGTDTTYTLDVNNPLKDETAQHVYHMMGNVREWCRDVWHRFPLDPNVQLPVDHVEGTSAGETNPKYVIRGASFDTQLPEEMARLTYRASAGECYYSAESDKSFPDVGFRLVLDIVIPESTPGGAGGQP